MAKTNLRVTRQSSDAFAALAFLNNQSGAERRVLERVADAAIRGQAVSANLQKIANLIIAKALFEGKLPPKAAGRPSDEKFELNYIEYAYRYFELLDKRVSPAAALVSEEFHVEERQVERYASKYKWLIGYLPDERDRYRAWRSGISADEYEAQTLLKIRSHDGRTLSGRPQADRFSSASALLENLRQTLADLTAPPSGSSGAGDGSDQWPKTGSSATGSKPP